MSRRPWNDQILDTINYQHFTAQVLPDSKLGKTSSRFDNACSVLKDGITWEFVMDMLHAFTIRTYHNPDIPYMYFHVRIGSFCCLCI